MDASCSAVAALHQQQQQQKPFLAFVAVPCWPSSPISQLPCKTAVLPSPRRPTLRSSPTSVRPLLPESLPRFIRQLLRTFGKKQLETLLLPANKSIWCSAAQQLREELAALRSLERDHLLEQRHRLQKCLYPRTLTIEPEEEEEGRKDERRRHEKETERSDGNGRQRQEGRFEKSEGEPEKREAPGNKMREKESLRATTSSEENATELEWTPEEVRLLWQGKAVTSKKRKPQHTCEQYSQWAREKLQQNLSWGFDSTDGESIVIRAEERAVGEPAVFFSGGDVRSETGRRRPAETLREEKEEGEEEEEQGDERIFDATLPVFGMRSAHKKKQLLARVRPVWLPQQQPLHCDTGLPKSLIQSTAGIAPPTPDEVRRLVLYPEEVERREVEDGAIFETAGELLRRRYSRLWTRYLQQREQREGGGPPRSRRRNQGGKRGSTSRRKDSESQGRKERERKAFFPAEEEGEVDAYEYAKSRRKYASVAFKELSKEGNWKASARDAVASTPLPPSWLLPQRSRRSAAFRHFQRAANTAVASRQVVVREEERWDVCKSHRGEDGDKKNRTKTLTRSTSSPYKSSTAASPGGALDRELVLAGEFKKGWLWTIEDTDRWKRSQLLRRAMKNQQVLFAADLEERQYAEDFQRFMKKPFIPPRLDWGGYAYYAAAGEERDEGEARKEGGRRGEKDVSGTRRVSSRRRDESKDETAVMREKAWREAFKAHVQHVEQREEEARKKAEREERLDKLQGGMQTRLVKLCEVLEGCIPSLFEDMPFPARNKHPKNRIVPFVRLRQHGEMIENITNCPFLQVDMQQALSEGWRYTRVHAAEVNHVPLPIGIPPDKYLLTEEKLKQAAEKLHVSPPEDEMSALTAARPQRVERTQEPEKVLGGGRYAV